MRLVRFLLSIFAALVAFDAAASGFGFDRLEAELRLRPEQKAQFDVAVGATQRALVAVAIAGFQMKQRLEDELAKPRPDLGALMQSHQDALRAAVEDAGPLFGEAREEWLRLYELLDDDQVGIAKRFLRERLGRLMKEASALRP